MCISIWCPFFFCKNNTKLYLKIINYKKVEKVDTWGNKKLAYQIAKFTEGFYVLVNFKSGVEVPKELDRNLKINENVIRHMIVVA